MARRKPDDLGSLRTNILALNKVLKERAELFAKNAKDREAFKQEQKERDKMEREKMEREKRMREQMSEPEPEPDSEPELELNPDTIEAKIIEKKVYPPKNDHSYNISTFMVDELLKQEIIINDKSFKLKITNVQNGQILGKGTYGFTYKFHKITDIVMKICLCDTMEKKQTRNNEIEFGRLTTLNNTDNIFVNTYGYFKLNEQNLYEYHNILAKTRSVPIERNPNYSKIRCESYMILELGETDLYDYYFLKRDEIKSDVADILANLYNNIYNLLNIYKMPMIKKQIYTHNDIKLENILIKNNMFKIFDFGLNKLQNEFFHQNQGAKEHMLLLFFPYVINSQFINSPLFDIFSICSVYFRIAFKIVYNIDLLSELIYDQDMQIKGDNYKIFISKLNELYERNKGNLEFKKIYVLFSIIKVFFIRSGMFIPAIGFLELILNQYFNITSTEMLPCISETDLDTLDQQYNYYQKFIKRILSATNITIKIPINFT